MTFTKFVEVGRVVRVNYGSQEGQLGVIVDVVNDNRVLVDGEHIKRQVVPIRRLQLTRLTVPVGHGSRTGAVRAVLAKEGLAKKWADSHAGKIHAQRAKRASLNDFERFKVTILRKRLSKLLRVRPAVASKKAAPAKAPADKKPSKKEAKK